MNENLSELAIKRQMAERVATLLVTMEFEMVELINNMIISLSTKHSEEKPRLRLVK